LPQHRSIYSDLDTHRLESKQHAVAGAKCRSQIKPAPVRSDVAGDHEQRGRQKVQNFATAMEIRCVVRAPVEFFFNEVGQSTCKRSAGIPREGAV
jgi:hypothetical protein